jgi:hypothetical protein
MDDNQENKAESAPDTNADLAAQLVREVKEGNERLVGALTQKQANQAPSGPTMEDTQAKADEARSKSRKRYSELMAEGEYEQAAIEFESGLERAQKILREAAPKADPDSDPAFQSFVETKLELAEMRDKDGLFEKYGDEIRSTLNELPANQRFTDKGIKEAMNRVRVQHVDEILESKMAARQQQQMMAPQNAPDHALNETQETELFDLDKDQRVAANMLGVPYKDYSEQVKAEESRAHTALTHDGMSVEILPKLDMRQPNGGIKRGGF